MDIKVKTLIFDMGMVLVDFHWRDFLAELGYESEQIEEIGRAVFRNPLWHEFDWGIMTDEEILTQMKRDAPHHVQDIDRIWENFQYVCKPFDYAEELIRSLHELGYKIYILSNFGNTLLHLERPMFTFLDYVDGSVISYAVQQMKPNDDIYESLLSKYTINPANAVFFDDLEANCETARKLGITAVQVKGLSSIIKGLEQECGVILPQMEKYLK
ncbi:MAG: HAD family phosphatase [Clostridiales bacterium]|nr:HAD family phosphatase [Clostridiales bacterium]